MRLTRILFKEKWRLHKKLIFQRKGVYKPVPLPQGLDETGQNPVDIQEFLYPPKKKWTPPPDDVRFSNLEDPIPDTEMPDYHEETLYQVSNGAKFSEGIDQACLLTKTQRFDGLPKHIQESVGKVSVKKQDFMVQRAIMQSQIWESSKEKLPKYFDSENLKYKFRRMIGIPNKKSKSILMNYLIALAQSLSAQYPSMATERQLVYKPTVETVYYHKDLKVRVSGEYEILVVGKKPLQRFGDADLVSKSADHQLHDMFPILPTIDMVPYNRYTVQEHGSLKDTGKGERARYPLTMFRAMNDLWKPEFHQAFNLMLCFAQAAQEARRLYGNDVKILPEPVTIQNINLDITTLNFLCFQLNTLDTQSDSGVKNLAWFDTGNQLFVKHFPKPWKEEAMYQRFRYEDYSPEVYQKFLAVYLNGVPELMKT